jgi:hypothetical protein
MIPKIFLLPKVKTSVTFAVVFSGCHTTNSGKREPSFPQTFPIFAQNTTDASTSFTAYSAFRQLNTPYPATAYIKGYLNTLGIEPCQADLGIEVILRLFSKSD